MVFQPGQSLFVGIHYPGVGNGRERTLESTIVTKKLTKIFAVQKKVVPLQSFREKGILRYGVMVALQILALSVRVRVLLSQQAFKA